MFIVYAVAVITLLCCIDLLVRPGYKIKKDE